MALSDLKIDKKIVLAVVAVFISGELIWAAITLFKTTTSSQSAPAMTTGATRKPSLTLQASKSSLKVGENVTIQINEFSPKPTDGTDVVILYDPKLLKIQPAANGSPVLVTTMYNQYPVNSVDEKNGRITVSGISSKSGGTLTQGFFGSVVFRAQAPGKTTVSLDYTPGKTTDSNIIETKTTKEILAEVGNVELNISQ